MKFLLFIIITVMVYSASCCSTSHHRHHRHHHHPKVHENQPARKAGHHVNETKVEPERARGNEQPSKQVVVNVVLFGAKGDGKTDDSQAFLKAWKKACSTKQSTFVVPPGKNYYLKPITFDGPCKSGITMNIQGNISASTSLSDYAKDRRHWLKFKSIEGLIVQGGGTFNGNGQIWWPKSCKKDKKQPCESAATALNFDDCTNLKVTNLNLKNPQQMHLIFQDCKNVEASRIMINAPKDSPNTDGIHVTGSQNVVIKECAIHTGDDCISIVSGSSGIKAMDIKCGPGHGISIGSLGKGGSYDTVSNVVVNRAEISNADNGVRIKSWQGGRGYAENIVFQNINMKNVTNPIIIDQYYCDKKEKNCGEESQAVAIRNVQYKNIRGTSSKDDGIIFKCSKSVPCEAIKLENVLLSYKGHSSEAACTSARVAEVGKIMPSCSTK